MNLCAGGETLLAKEVLDIIHALLEEGHYIMVVTNGVLTKRFDEIASFAPELLERLFFKFSFHYKELVRLNKIDEFFDNVLHMKRCGCSFTVELTTNDESVADIEVIKELCMSRLGALCHVTLARDDTKADTPLLTKYPIQEYKDIWGGFSSALFDFKLDLYQVPRKEFCYAGEWCAYLNLGTGELYQCYRGSILQNIFKNINEPIRFVPIGYHCREPYCYNGHAFLTLGAIPDLKAPAYAQMRNRTMANGEEWLTPVMKQCMNSQLKDAHTEYSPLQKVTNNFANAALLVPTICNFGVRKIKGRLK